MTKTAVLLLTAAVECAWAQTGVSISGTVTDAVNHRGLAGALVSTNGTRGLTGADGSFIINDVVPGDVNIRVKLQGYRQFETTAKAAAAGLTKVDFELHPLAKIWGRVIDRDTGATLPRTVLVEAVKTLQSGGVSADHKDGFEIPSLEPGDYTLDLPAMDEAVVSYDPVAKPFAKAVYGAAQYPGTIHLSEGEQRFIEIPIRRVETHAVSGAIELPPGVEVAPLSIAYAGGDGGMFSHDLGRRGAGAFRVDGLVPGRYRILAESGEGSARGYGSVAISVTDHDVEGLRISMRPGVDITGQFRMTSESEPLPARLPDFMAILMHTERGAGRIVQLKTLNNGTFHEEGVPPGDYWAEALELPDGYAVSRVLLGGVDTEFRPITLSASSNLTLVLTSKPGTVVGTVRNKARDTVKGAIVSASSEFGNKELRRGTLSGEHGEFQFRNLSPGKYSIENGPVFEVRAGETTTVEMVSERR